MIVNNFFACCLYLLSIYIPGMLLSFLLPLKQRYMSLVLGYGLGTGLITAELFIYFFIFKFSFSAWLYIFILLQTVICLVFMVVVHKEKLHCKKIIPDHWKFTEIGLAALITICILFSVVQAAVKPPVTFDALANWSKRAKILERDGQIDFNTTSDNYLASPATATYPWHTSLSEYWLRQLGGGEISVNFIPLGYFVCITLALYFCLSQRLNRFFSLSLVLIFASMPLISYHSFNAYADVPLSYYVVMSIILFIQWQRDKPLLFLYFSATFMGWGLFVKNDGLFPIIGWLLALLLTWYLDRKKISWKLGLKPIVFLMGPLIFWLGFKFASHLSFSNFSISKILHPEIFSSLLDTLFVHNSWNVWWFIFLGVVVIKFKQIYTKKESWPLWFFFIVVFGLTVAVFLGTEYYQYALNFTAIERTLIPLVPISILLVGLALEEDKISI